MLTGRSYTTSLGRPCLRESEASAGEFPLVFDGLGVFRGHFYRVIDFPNPRQNCHRTTGDPRPAAEWARWAGLSSRSLSRLFGAETGMSFAQWRQLARLHAAVERLAAGQAVGEVAWSLGYESPSSFASAFRTVFGETPSGYSSRANEALA